ncbi:MAG: cyclic nucleotide-binding domain-containing protein [Sulfitobacter sp.]|nr:cyclic nucleotide-binding domain-containing protein [Sulfitobacter sp.]
MDRLAKETPLDLSLSSALSPGGLVGHVAYVLLVASMLMRSITALRLLVIASALVAMVYAALWLGDPVSLFWEGMLVIVNVFQIVRQWLANRRARFSPEEERLVSERLGSLSRQEARHLLNLGLWLDGVPGTVLTTEGEPVQHLVYLATGMVQIEAGGQTVGACVPGNFVGEMSVLESGPASATATVSKPSRYWLIPADKLRRLHRKRPTIAAALELGIARDLKTKILNANARHRGAG